MAKKRYIIPIFIPHKGCPHDCSFCNQKKIAGQTTDMNEKAVEEQITAYFNFFPKSDIEVEVAYYGGSFTGLPQEKQEELLAPAYMKKQEGKIQQIRVSTRPDYISVDVLQVLKKYGVSIIELGVQSTNNRVLDLNNRGMVKEDIIRAVKLIQEQGFQLGLQMMVGLMGDDDKTIMQTAQDIIALSPDFVRIYPTVVIQDTALAGYYNAGKYKPYTLEKAISICKEILHRFQRHGIPVIRLGLQASDEVSFEGAIVAGPFHPNFREMVESELYKDRIEAELLENQSKGNTKGLVIYCHPSDASKVAGYKQSNKKYFKEKYCIEKIEINPSPHVPRGEIEIKRSLIFIPRA